MKCFDTTFMIDFLRAKTQEKRLPPLDFCTTQINAYELFVGIYRLKTENKQKRLDQAEDLLKQLIILPFSDLAMRRAAEIAGILMQQGREINQNDCITAAISLSHGISTIVTQDAEHFRRIPQITVETY